MFSSSQLDDAETAKESKRTEELEAGPGQYEVFCDMVNHVREGVRVVVAWNIYETLVMVNFAGCFDSAVDVPLTPASVCLLSLPPFQVMILLNTLAIMFHKPNPESGYVKTTVQERFALIDVVSSAR